MICTEQKNIEENGNWNNPPAQSLKVQSHLERIHLNTFLQVIVRAYSHLIFFSDTPKQSSQALPGPSLQCDYKPSE